MQFKWSKPIMPLMDKTDNWLLKTVNCIMMGYLGDWIQNGEPCNYIHKIYAENWLRYFQHGLVNLLQN